MSRRGTKETTTMTRTLSTLLVATTLVFATTACDGGDAKKTDTKVVTKTEVKKTTPDVKVDAKTDIKTAAPADPKPEDKPAADPNAEKVQLAATIAREISSAPEQADEILGKHGLDRSKFDAMIFEIAGDPALTKAYMAARKAS